MLLKFGTTMENLQEITDEGTDEKVALHGFSLEKLGKLIALKVACTFSRPSA